MLQILFTPKGSIAAQGMVLSGKTNCTMKLLGKIYPANNQWMKLMTGKSIILVLPCVKCVLAGGCFKEPMLLPI